ncbi:hypothetical protein BH10PSE9_BH10PSE9_03390 [soil metagenome]
MTAPIRRIDAAIYRLITRAWPAGREREYARAVVAAHSETVLPLVLREHFAIIDGKSAALLTHTSMMVAAIGIAATIIAGSKFEQAIMIAEIMLYLLVAIACLRCSSLFREVTEDNVGDGSMERELILRRELFMFCNTATIYLTILVLVTLPIVLYL